MTPREVSRAEATRRPRRKQLALAIAGGIFGAVSSAGAALITVDDDGDNGGAGCTLRNAILSANRDEAVGGCRSGSGSDGIFFDPSLVPGTINLCLLPPRGAGRRQR